MLVTTEAIILKSMKYRDTSKIVTFYTKEYGKTKGIAKGARTAKNKFGSALEPITQSALVFYKKPHRDIHLISQCDAIESFKGITKDLDRMVMAFAVIELTNQVTHDEEKNPALYNLLLETLGVLNMGTKNYTTYLQAFRLRLATLFGYAPNFSICGDCGKSILIENGEKRFAFQIARGAILCNKCCMPNNLELNSADKDIPFISVSASGLQVIRRLAEAKLDSLSNLEFNIRVGNEIDTLLRLYLRYHFDGIKPLKSTELFYQHKISAM